MWLECWFLDESLRRAELLLKAVFVYLQHLFIFIFPPLKNTKLGRRSSSADAWDLSFEDCGDDGDKTIGILGMAVFPCETRYKV